MVNLSNFATITDIIFGSLAVMYGAIKISTGNFKDGIVPLIVGNILLNQAFHR